MFYCFCNNNYEILIFFIRSFFCCDLHVLRPGLFFDFCENNKDQISNEIDNGLNKGKLASWDICAKTWSFKITPNGVLEILKFSKIWFFLFLAFDVLYHHPVASNSNLTSNFSFLGSMAHRNIRDFDLRAILFFWKFSISLPK